MGNTCGCVDPAEKDGEVKVENKVNNNRQQERNNYRDSTLSKNYAQGIPGQTYVPQTADGLPHLFDTEDQYLLDL